LSVRVLIVFGDVDFGLAETVRAAPPLAVEVLLLLDDLADEAAGTAASRIAARPLAASARTVRAARADL
jgi:hypothetical protein